MLSFTQLNLHKATQATLLLGRGLEGKKQTIAMITEPHTYKNKITGMPRGTKAIYARTPDCKPAPRAGIVASLDTKVTAMDSWCNRDCAVALTNIGGQQTVLISLYLDIKLEVQPDWLDNLMEMINRKGYPLIISVDSNAHSTLYGPDDNARGSQMEDFILQYGLRVENVGSTPTFQVMRGTRHVRTHIDVTLSRGLSAGIKEWRVCSDYNASDHNTILFHVETNKPEPELVRPWSTADWDLFRSHLRASN